MNKLNTIQRIRIAIRTAPSEDEALLAVDQIIQEEQNRLLEEVLKLPEMQQVRHITNTREIENIVEENEGNVSFDEVANVIQNDIDAQNELRRKLKSSIEELKEGVK